ncbi:NAD(P)/FAD-dependent oxidoreductase [Mycolicibacterium septicum]|uniref:NAD(P)-binding domain-containing protein n=1 Tax=Mycolicibacterium septicum TaxID=98668 RepID=UPI0023E1FCF4|nr:NAD(P)/FAD-dependent oxidoreductase [Mycolicibacterium septicum]MDF3336375.1 NAD(P)/FAD-dependent oxidoreductase [Mycolicibacterium septicum]
MTTQDLDITTADLAARESLRLLGLDGNNWIAPRDDVDHDVAIIGAGQSGITTAHALLRAGVAKVTVIDSGQQDADLAWQSRARMRTLRTAKSISGPELGNPALSFRAWYESNRGEAAFDDIDRIPTSDWADYLSWFREQTGIAVRRGIRVTDIAPGTTGLRLTLEQDRRQWTEHTRKLVLAGGVSGTGGPHIPAELRGLSNRLWAHTADLIDFDALHGKTVAVLGAAASAYDAAATALEAGATEVHVYTRRPAVVVANLANRPNPLVQDVFHLLSDAERWEQRVRAARQGANVPEDSVARAAAFPNYHLHVSAPWSSASERGGRVLVEAGDGARTFDFVIAGTGYQQDPATRPELATIAPYIARWQDVYPAPPGLGNEILGVAPYLGPGYQLAEKEPGSAPWLADIHVFSIGANVSFGRPVGDIPSLRIGVPRLAEAITRDLVLADLRAAGDPR